MDYLTKDGRRNRVHKLYVDVVMRLTDEGRTDPLAVLWPDGRTFRIDEILARGHFGPAVHGAQTARFRVRFGGHETELFLEKRSGVAAMGTPETLRWWVYAIDSTRAGSAPEKDGPQRIETL